jgi:hypothetical protein
VWAQLCLTTAAWASHMQRSHLAGLQRGLHS